MSFNPLLGGAGIPTSGQAGWSANRHSFQSPSGRGGHSHFLKKHLDRMLGPVSIPFWAGRAFPRGRLGATPKSPRLFQSPSGRGGHSHYLMTRSMFFLSFCFNPLLGGAGIPTVHHVTPSIARTFLGQTPHVSKMTGEIHCFRRRFFGFCSHLACFLPVTGGSPCPPFSRPPGDSRYLPGDIQVTPFAGYQTGQFDQNDGDLENIACTDACFLSYSSKH